MGGSRLGAEPDILHVPVFARSAGIVAIRTGRLLPSGDQAGLGFTSQARLAAVLGPTQAWILLPLQLLRELLAARGITQVRVDPRVWRPAPLREARPDRTCVAAARPRLHGPQAGLRAAPRDARKPP